MSDRIYLPNRRLFLGAAGAAFFTTPGLFADELVKTPKQTEGPFYPDKLPLDTDNDLLIVNDGITPAVGEITHLTGKILDAKGNPLAGAVVEIWQCDGNGVYLHTGDSKGKKDQQDKNFQGFGRFTTDKTGAYYFRTIKPVAYPGRCPHIHYKIKKGGKELLTSQIMIAGSEQNARDGVFKSAGGVLEQELMLAEFKKLKDSKVGELEAKFDIVLGKTPDEKK